MSQIVDGPFKSAAEKVEEAHNKSVEELKAAVAKAKSEALKKITT
jgi:hypothetical protein